MRIENFDLEKIVLVIAEIGNNHEGSYTLAEEMVGLAKAAGVGAVKFQTFKTEEYVSRVDKARFQRLKSFELSHAQFEKLNRYSREAGLLFISTPFDLDSARFLAPLVSAFKISSSDNTFYPLLEEVAKADKPVILSSGLVDIQQLEFSVSFLKSRCSVKDLAVLHCVTSYPVPVEDANLAAINAIRSRCRCTVGYSDHTLGVDAAVLAVALGSRIIEKHFTLNKNHSAFRDHQISADPEEMKILVQKIKHAEVLLGTGTKTPQNSEIDNEAAVRRSLTVKTDLPLGHTISWKDLSWTRPAGGYPPGKETVVLGRVLSQSMRAGEKFTPECFLD